MIKQIHQLAQVQNALNSGTKGTQFNATLPVRLEVLEKLQGIRYMVKVGNIELQTKSLRELEIGGKYWAQMGRSSVGGITLGGLTKQPAMLEQSAPLRLNSQALREFLNSGEDPFSAMKGFLADRLTQAESKWEFAFLGQMLMSLKNKVLTLPLRYDDKDSIMQMRKKRAAADEKCLEFYCAFSHLGGIYGLLWDFSDGVRLDLSVMYESVAALLKRNLSELAFIKQANINLDPAIAPLYEFSDRLLDIRG